MPRLPSTSVLIKRKKVTTKIAFGLLVGLLIWGGLPDFRHPRAKSAKAHRALLVVAMTVGYTIADRYFARAESTTAQFCGGPTGETVASVVTARPLKP